jgi:hypothetical protein
VFIPIRKDGLLFKRTGQNAYNEPTYSPRGVRFGWGPVYMRDSLDSTEVRADKSASKSRAEIEKYDYRMIVEKTVSPAIGDRITLGTGEVMKISRAHRRVDIVGKMHHWEIDCVAD